MPPPTDLLRLPEKNKLSIAKLAAFLAGVISVGALIVLAIPYLSTAGLRHFSSLRLLFAPPYLFITVNFIIFTIWKLSQNITLQSDQLQGEEMSTKSRDPASSTALQLLQQSTRTDPAGNLTESAAAFDEHSSLLASESYSVTAPYSSSVFFQGKVNKGMTAAGLPAGEVDEVIDVADSNWKARFLERIPKPTLISNRSRDLRPYSPSQLLSKSSQPDPIASGENRSLVPAPESSCNTADSHGNVAAAMKAVESPVEQEEAVTDFAGVENDTMEATWTAIMKKAEIWEKSSPPKVKPSLSPAAVKLPARASRRGGGALWEGDEDVNLRFDDFIKKNYEQIRIRRAGNADDRRRMVY